VAALVHPAADREYRRRLDVVGREHGRRIVTPRW
jgi:hypothetical protein